MNIKCIYLRDKLKKYIKNSISNRKYPIRPSESELAEISLLSGKERTLCTHFKRRIVIKK